jgi:diguanylate cyclase (GGDEF)-like protein
VWAKNGGESVNMTQAETQNLGRRTKGIEVIAQGDVTTQVLEAHELSADAFLLHRADGSTLYANPAARRMIQIDESKPGWPYREQVAQALEHIIIPNTSIEEPWSGELEIRDAFGVPRFLQVVVSLASRDEHPNVMVTAHDVTKRRVADRENAQLAFSDELTGLPNRAALKRRLEGDLGGVRPLGTVAALFVDLDRFKAVNDTLGHHVGDELLTMVAARLTSVIRPGDLLARLGGDEFVIVVEGDDPQALMRRAEGLATSSLAVLSAPFPLVDNEVYISASIGIATNDELDGSASSLLRHADVAMFRAKNTGRGRIVRFNPSLIADGAHSLKLDTALHRAVDNNEFEVVYQPIHTLTEGTPCLGGFEALVRWRDNEGIVHAPARFLEAANQSDLITVIDTLVMETACNQLAQWTRQWPGSDQIARSNVSVNVSARQLARPEFPALVLSALSTSGLDAHRLVIEITEAAMMSDVNATMAALVELRAMGVTVAIDDFGMGSCSLSHLREFKANLVKINRNIVMDVSGRDHEPDAQVIVAIAQLAATFNMDAVAIGVETEHQLEILESVGCTAVQGYLFDQALTPAQVEQRMQGSEGRTWAPRAASRHAA